MNAKKCDRCNKFYDAYTPDGDTYRSNMLIFAEDIMDRGFPSYCEHRQFELCPECMKDAIKFMNEKLPIRKE